MPSADLSHLTTEVEETTTAIASAVVLIEGLSAKIRDAANDPAAIKALADQLDTSSNALAAAVVANTPAVP